MKRRTLAAAPKLEAELCGPRLNGRERLGEQPLPLPRVAIPPGVSVRRREQDARAGVDRDPAQLDGLLERARPVIAGRDRVRVNVDEPGHSLSVSGKPAGECPVLNEPGQGVLCRDQFRVAPTSNIINAATAVLTRRACQDRLLVDSRGSGGLEALLLARVQSGGLVSSVAAAGAGVYVLRLRALVWSGVVALLTTAVVVGGVSPARGGVSSGSSAGPGSVSALARSTVSATVGRGQSAYRVRKAVGGLRVVNGRAGLSASFSPVGVSVRAGRSVVGFGFEGMGRGSVSPLPSSPAVAVANRVVFRHGAVTEWWVNGPAGLEQGFTVRSRPAGTGRLTLAMWLRGVPLARVDQSGLGMTLAGSLRYQGLVAVDATGRQLPARLVLRQGRLLIRVDDRGARYPVRVDPFVQQAKLTPSDGGSTDALGYSVAVAGDTIAVGAPGAIAQDEGAVYVFVKPQSGWANATETARLTASDGAPNNGDVGSSVAISPTGDVIVAGAPYQTGPNSGGGVYVWVKPGSGGWVSANETVKLADPGGSIVDYFGWSVATNGTSIVVGDYDSEHAYVYTGLPTPTLAATLTAAGDDGNFIFGYSVGINQADDTIVVGASDVKVGSSDQAGAVYVFTKVGTWQSTVGTVMLTASDASSPAILGRSVAIDGNTVVAGAPLASDSHGNYAGAAYVFVKPQGGWASATENAKLTASDESGGADFGLAVAISGQQIVVGAPGDPSTDTGAAYEYDMPQGGWAGALTETQKLTGSDAAVGSQYGRGVAINNGTIVAGAAYSDINMDVEFATGAAYVYGTGTTSGLVVNSTGDLPDTNPGDGVCDTGQTVTVNSQQVPECTLRAAIQESDALQSAGKGPQTITFALAGSPATATISLQSKLPAVDGMTTIDASSEPGITVTNSNQTHIGFDLDGQGSTIRGLKVDISGTFIPFQGVTPGDAVILEGSGGHQLFGDTFADGHVRVRSGGNTIGAGSLGGDACTGDCDTFESGSDVLITGGQGNLVAGDRFDGDRGNRTGNPAAVAVSGGSGTVIGPGNVIVNEQSGIVLAAPATVKGNDIGVFPSGAIQAPCDPAKTYSTSQRGILVQSAGVTIGGPNTGDANVISGWGVGCPPNISRTAFGGIVAAGAVGALIEGNLIGTDPTGSKADANANGIILGGGSSGTSVLDNVISGNLLGLDDFADPSVLIAANRIGTNSAGDTAIPNQTGVDAEVGTVGGARPGSSTGCVSPCNLISGNDVGVEANGTVEGNFIGTSLDGASPIPNRVGVSHASGSPNTVEQIGGPDGIVGSAACTGDCNLIAYNHYGIELGTPLVAGGQGAATIQGNLISSNQNEGVGIGPNGQPDGTTTIGGPNAADGNLITGNGRGVLVGATGPPGISNVQITHNAITQNRAEGVLIANTPNVVGITVRMNQISGNSKLGIDLSLAPAPGLLFQGDGPTPDQPNTDGPNHLEPFPQITNVTKAGGTVTITGRLPFFRGANGAGFRQIDIYGNPACDPSGYGQGQTYLGTAQTSPLNNGRFTLTRPAPAPTITTITATSTAPNGSTSEYSRCATIP